MIEKCPSCGRRVRRQPEKHVAPTLGPQQIPEDVAAWIASPNARMPVPAAVVDALEIGLEAGWNTREIAQALGVGYKRLRSLAARNGIVGLPLGRPRNDRAKNVRQVDLFGDPLQGADGFVRRAVGLIE